VQDLFLTETAALADVVFPAASLYEKTGTVTNTYGDVQLVKKAADHAGVKPDFEILVRLAGGHGRRCEDGLDPALRQRTSACTEADLGRQSRGAQSGEADRHSVWLAANNLEPKLSPFDPLAVLDEIERLVPGYALDRINLFHRQRRGAPNPASFPSPPWPLPPATSPPAGARHALFTSSTVGRY
jgi:NADH-quinone oxidoreductase subunit G